MSETSSIEWTDATWNPVRGCTKVSAGCKHCYAHTFAERFRGVPNHPYELGFDIRTAPAMLQQPLKWKRPRKIFVNSMSDLFHPAVPDSYIEQVCRVMVEANWHTYQILTKRSERMRDLLNGRLRKAATLSNIWWGVSVENRRDGLPRVAHLTESKARTRFLSIEPLLEDLGAIELSVIDWVIVGGESGHGARPMEATWVDSIRSQCSLTNTAFFFKQWGGHNKAKAGRQLNGRTYDEMPTLPARLTGKLYTIEPI